MSSVDRAVGMGAVLGGILLAVAGWRLDLGTSKLPGPGFFPLLIACTIGGLGIWLLLHPKDGEKPVQLCQEAAVPGAGGCADRR